MSTDLDLMAVSETEEWVEVATYPLTFARLANTYELLLIHPEL